MNDSLVVNEIYLSIQGESTFSGLPCVFIRLTGCNLRCSYCDTVYAFKEGKRMPITEILEEVQRLVAPYPVSVKPTVELTGGEPLLQHNSPQLVSALLDNEFQVLIETSGAHDIRKVSDKAHRIMDIKCPSSGEMGRMLWENLDHLTNRDELKFVIGSREDYQWASELIVKRELIGRCELLFSWVSPLSEDQKDDCLKNIPKGHTPISRMELVDQIIADALPVRFQLQMHKFVWNPEERGR
ncbi:radical SAM protein [Verrucomicrobia bacterium]|nr:radical SAM protein [Verrucomicrobiota bacterium]